VAGVASRGEPARPGDRRCAATGQRDRARRGNGTQAAWSPGLAVRFAL